MKKLVGILAEKPSQAKAYSEAYTVEKRDKFSITLKPCSTFPDGAIIVWAIGHLVSLNMPGDYKDEWKHWNLKSLPIIPNEFIYRPSEPTKSHYMSTAKVLRSVSSIIIGSDIDREGEAIARLIINQAKADDKPIKRLWINSLEIDNVRKGFQNLKDGSETYNLFLEAQARQKSDWLVGMNLSPLYSLILSDKGINNFGSFSIGRVQIPTLVLINERQKSIAEFVSKPFYRIEANFLSENGKYKGMAEIKTDTKKEVQETLKKYEIDKKDEGYIQSIDKVEKRVKSPRLHSLSSLQGLANKKWKYTPSDTLKIAQELYEKKILTYPRTDCNYITTSEFEYLQKNVDEYKRIANVSFENVNNEAKTRYVNNKKVQEHFAIVPTKTIPSEGVINGLSDKQKNLYYEVLLNTLAMFHEDYIFEETIVITNVKNLEFKTTGKVEVEKGWKSLLKSSKEDEEKTDQLPQLVESEEVQAEIGIKESFTNPPKSFTEGELINLMKTCGKFVEDEADSDILKDVEGIGTEATRANIIERIKDQNYIEVVKNIVSVTGKGQIICEAVEGTLLASPSMTAKWEMYLKKIGEGKASQESFVQNTQKFIEKLIADVPEQLNKNEKISEIAKKTVEENSIGKCPICKKGDLTDRKSFYGCSEYDNGCKFSISKTIAKKKLTQKNIKDLIGKGVTSKIKGFQSKAGKSFEATLIVEKDKVSFKF